MAFKISAIYVFTGCLWILFSDEILRLMVDGDISKVVYYSSVKGWGFVIVTSLLLFLLIKRYTDSMYSSQKELLNSHQELTAAYEEITAMEEELRQQCDELLANNDIIRQHNDCLNLLHDISLKLLSKNNLDEVLQDIVDKAAELGKSQHAYLYLLAADETALMLTVRTGLALREIGYCQQKGEGLVGTVWETGEPLVIHDYKNWTGRLSFSTYDEIETSLGLPIKSNGKIVGVFGLNFTNPREIDATELKLLRSFAELASLALNNARLYTSLQQELKAHMETEKALQESEAHSRALIEAQPDFIVRLDGMGTITWLKPSRDFVITLPLHEKLVGRYIGQYLPDHVTERILYYVSEALDTKSTQTFDYDIEVDGQIKHREMRAVPCCENNVLIIVRDITERINMERQLRYLGLHDPITGLYNRVYFEEAISRLEEAQTTPVGVVVCDLDGLKLINDTLGHMRGDKLLFTAARILDECMTSGHDIVARVGGDEFAVLMPYSNMDSVQHTYRCIQEAISTYNSTNADLPLSLSIGTAVKTDKSLSLTEVFKEADNNMYREKLHHSQSNRSAIVQTLATALEARDFVTDGHADRLQDIVVAMGVALGMNDSMTADLKLLGRFHDIGKVGIPDHILFKPGRLTDEEFSIMKRHSEIGYRIAQASPDLSPIADWILKHHEWYSGTGYPLGLKGDAIPLACRILSIADAYDAMTNDRPYRKAIPHAEAIAELRRCSGVQFDPKLVELFDKVIQSELLK